jgi:hypothetical protein
MSKFEIVLYNASGYVVDRTEFSDRDRALVYARELLDDYAGHQAVLIYVQPKGEGNLCSQSAHKHN